MYDYDPERDRILFRCRLKWLIVEIVFVFGAIILVKMADAGVFTP